MKIQGSSSKTIARRNWTLATFSCIVWGQGDGKPSCLLAFLVPGWDRIKDIFGF